MPIVLIQGNGLSGQTARAAHDGNTLPDTLRVVSRTRRVGEIEIHVVNYHEIEIAIAVEIQEGATSAPTRGRREQTPRFGLILKCSITLVSIENISTPLCNEQIWMTIVVNVAHANPLSPTRVRDSCLFGHVLKFEDVTKKAGIAHTGWGQGVCVGDVDNDGHPDLFITQWGRNVLYRNQGNGTFQDETKARGLLQSTPRWSTGGACLDFNRDGYLDLMVVHYVDFDLAHTPRPGDNSQCIWKGIPVMCGPRGLPGETVSLYQNDGHGRFADVSDELHITGPKNYYGFTALTGDFDNDGWPDIYVACDSTANLYYHNLGGKTFEEIGVRSGLAYNEDGREQAGMGVSAADIHGDGLLDIFKTNFADDTHTFYRNQGDNRFEDATVVSGLAVNTKYLGWGTAFVDIDNDGWKDLIVANGHVYPEVDSGRTSEKF